MNSGPRNSAVFLHRIDVCPSCVIEFQVTFLDQAMNCVTVGFLKCHRTYVTGSITAVTVSSSVLPEALSGLESLNLFTVLFTVDVCFFFKFDTQ